MMNKDFEKNGYVFRKNFVEPDIARLLSIQFNYMFYNDEGIFDTQVPGSYFFYSTPQLDLLQFLKLSEIESIVGKKLYPTYNFVRVYYKGQELVSHTDRNECEYSFTLQLSKDGDWPFLIQGYKDTEMVGYEMDPGDCIVYDGTKLEHCRKECPVDWYLQAFVHYVDANGPHKHTAYDGRDFNMPISFERKHQESNKEIENANRLFNSVSTKS